jgi:hypothetical protein
VLDHEAPKRRSSLELGSHGPDSTAASRPGPGCCVRRRGSLQVSLECCGPARRRPGVELRAKEVPASADQTARNLASPNEVTESGGSEVTVIGGLGESHHVGVGVPTTGGQLRAPRHRCCDRAGRHPALVDRSVPRWRSRCVVAPTRRGRDRAVRRSGRPARRIGPPRRGESCAVAGDVHHDVVHSAAACPGDASTAAVTTTGATASTARTVYRSATGAILAAGRVLPPPLRPPCCLHQRQGSGRISQYSPPSPTPRRFVIGRGPTCWLPLTGWSRSAGLYSPWWGVVEAKGIEPTTSCVPCDPTCHGEVRRVTKSLTFQRLILARAGLHRGKSGRLAPPVAPPRRLGSGGPGLVSVTPSLRCLAAPLL